MNSGMLRLYSDDDIIRLRIIKHLVNELRLNLAGVETCANWSSASALSPRASRRYLDHVR
ncbi:MAG: MerR family transcriptional regulator [Chloroflexota bacterium]|nr:MerR family transcriptional regulator [Chloroflexota bacterium]